MNTNSKHAKNAIQQNHCLIFHFQTNHKTNIGLIVEYAEMSN
jgi:hypothetical protein